MRRYTVLIVLILLLGAAAIYLLTPRPLGNWRQVTLSFGGITNYSAVISISNAGPVAVVLRDHFELEFVGLAPPAGSTGLSNLVISTPTGTNLIVAPSQQTAFLISIPTEGERWIARLEFAPAGMKTRLGEFLIRRQDRFSTSLPVTIRGVPIYVVSQEFTK